MTDINDRINYIIEKEGLTIAAFAKKIGIKDQTIRNSIRSRKNNPGYDVILAICQNFPWLNVEWLITGNGEETKEETNNTSNAGDTISIPKEAWDIITKQANSLSKKDEQLDELIALIKKSSVRPEGNADYAAAM